MPNLICKTKFKTNTLLGRRTFYILDSQQFKHICHVFLTYVQIIRLLTPNFVQHAVKK